MYAAIDNGNITGAVYGIGETEDAAREDAARSGAGRDTVAVVPCSDEAADWVREHGGAPSKEVAVNRWGVRTREQQDAVELRNHSHDSNRLEMAAKYARGDI